MRYTVGMIGRGIVMLLAAPVCCAAAAEPCTESVAGLLYEAALRGESDRIEALQKANDVIEELFIGNPHQKRMAVDEQTREILQQLAERVYG